MTDKPTEDKPLNPEEAEDLARKAEKLMFRDMAQYMSQFARSFEASARRWELVVYPSLLAFIILAIYGFFLIYRLTSDIGLMANRVEEIAESMVNINQNFSSTTNNMNTMTKSMLKITEDMTEMTMYLETTSRNVEEQNAAMGDIVVALGQMNKSVDSMSFTMYQMQYDTMSMGRNMQNVSGPMRFMNNFVPW